MLVSVHWWEEAWLGPRRILRLVLAHQWEELGLRVSSCRILVVLE